MTPWSVAEAPWAAQLKTLDGPPSLHPAWVPVLGRVELFKSLSNRHLKKVGNLAELKRFKKGATIVKEGARGDAFYIILDGQAELTTSGGLKHMLSAGDSFGELALLDGHPRAATITATDQVAAAVIPRVGFQKLLKDEPAITLSLAHGLVAIIRELQGVRSATA